jgi:hypothetical protein
MQMTLAQALMLEIRDIGSESQFKVDRADADSALFDAGTAATAKIYSLQNAYSE